MNLDINVLFSRTFLSSSVYRVEYKYKVIYVEFRGKCVKDNEAIFWSKGERKEGA